VHSLESSDKTVLITPLALLALPGSQDAHRRGTKVEVISRAGRPRSLAAGGNSPSRARTCRGHASPRRQTHPALATTPNSTVTPVRDNSTVRGTSRACDRARAHDRGLAVAPQRGCANPNSTVNPIRGNHPGRPARARCLPDTVLLTPLTPLPPTGVTGAPRREWSYQRQAGEGAMRFAGSLAQPAPLIVLLGVTGLSCQGSPVSTNGVTRGGATRDGARASARERSTPISTVTGNRPVNPVAARVTLLVPLPPLEVLPT
jgi:hypothetical protein